MKILLFIYFVALVFYSKCSQLTRVVEIMTWNPADEDIFDTQNLLENVLRTLEESYLSGKGLTDSDKVGFYQNLTEEDIRFFSPNYFLSYAMSYAHLEGLLSKTTNKQFDQVKDEITHLKKLEVDS